MQVMLITEIAKGQYVVDAQIKDVSFQTAPATRGEIMEAFGLRYDTFDKLLSPSEDTMKLSPEDDLELTVGILTDKRSKEWWTEQFTKEGIADDPARQMDFIMEEIPEVKRAIALLDNLNDGPHGGIIQWDDSSLNSAGVFGDTVYTLNVTIDFENYIDKREFLKDFKVIFYELNVEIGE